MLIHEMEWMERACLVRVCVCECVGVALCTGAMVGGVRGGSVSSDDAPSRPEDFVCCLRRTRRCRLCGVGLSRVVAHLDVTGLVGVKSAGSVAVLAPLGRRQQVVLRLEGHALLDQLVEAGEVDPRVPPVGLLELLVRNQHAARVLVLARQLVVVAACLGKLLAELQHLRVERHVAHRQVRRRRLAAPGDALHLDEVRLSALHDRAVVLHLRRIPVLHKREAEHRPLPLRTHVVDTLEETLPEVVKDGAVDLLHRVLRRGVDGDVQLRHRLQLLDLLGELRVRDHERRDLTVVQAVHELVDLRVDDRLANQRQRAVRRLHGSRVPLRDHTLDALQRLDHLLLPLNGLVHDQLRVVHLPLPLLRHRVGVVAPAEHALVRARERRRHLHALVRGDAVEGVLVAPSAAAHLRLRPPAQLHAGVRADQVVPLLLERLPHARVDHLRVRVRLRLADHVLHVRHALLAGGLVVGLELVLLRAHLVHADVLHVIEVVDARRHARDPLAEGRVLRVLALVALHDAGPEGPGAQLLQVLVQVLARLVVRVARGVVRVPQAQHGVARARVELRPAVLDAVLQPRHHVRARRGRLAVLVRGHHDEDGLRLVQRVAGLLRELLDLCGPALLDHDVRGVLGVLLAAALHRRVQDAAAPHAHGLARLQAVAARVHAGLCGNGAGGRRRLRHLRGAGEARAPDEEVVAEHEDHAQHARHRAAQDGKHERGHHVRPTLLAGHCC
eukprot:Rhum_TRINITY_DN14594_c22_g1::Rhum_TRINITY_DN14594_c22_g1_i1::g.101554::m.101554